MAETVTVTSGQTLSSIAKAKGTTVQALLDANPVLTTNPKYKNGSVLFSGTKIKIPGAAPAVPTVDQLQTAVSALSKPTGPTQAEMDAIAADVAAAKAAQTAAKTNAEKLAAAVGAKIDTATGKIQKDTVTNPQGIYQYYGVTPSAKTVVSVNYIGTGKNRVKVTKYSDGTETREAAPEGAPGDEQYDVTPKGATLVSTFVDPTTGDIVGVFSDGSTKILAKGAGPEANKEYTDAYTLLEQTFKDYGLEELVPNIKSYMEKGIGSKQATVELKETEAYKNRFRGNEMRRAAGRNVYDEATYLAIENQYDEILKSYGLQGYFGVDRKARNAKMANFIGNDIAAPEFKDRIDLAVTRVSNSDNYTKSVLKKFYNIGDTDLVNYFLNPKEALPQLEQKVRTGEIGGAAEMVGLQTDIASALGLAQLGVTKAQAQQGYTQIGQYLPGAEKLSDIYAAEGIDYTQKTAEEEQFKGMASAARARQRLASREISAFSGTSGAGRTSLNVASEGLI